MQDTHTTCGSQPGRTRAGRHRWNAPLRPSLPQIAPLANSPVCSLLCEWYIHSMVEGSLGPGPELSGTCKATHKHWFKHWVREQQQHRSIQRREHKQAWQGQLAVLARIQSRPRMPAGAACMRAAPHVSWGEGMLHASQYPVGGG